MSSHEFDLGPLTWVKPEIDQALGRGLEALRAFAANPAESTQLKHAQTHLHQVSGALQIVGLEGVTAYSEEMERQLSGLAEATPAAVAEILALVQRASERLTAYLNDLVDGGAHIPLTLYPEYEAMQHRRGIKHAPPADLFFPDLSLRPPKAPPRPALSADAMRELLKARRRDYQLGLLRWLKGDVAGAATMRDALAAIEGGQTAAAQRAFWWCATGLMDALAHNGLNIGFGAKQLCGRIDLQVRRMIEGSVKVAERLQRDILYYVAVSQPVSELVRDVQRVFELRQLLPTVTEQSAGTAAKLAAVREAKDVLATAKEVWLKVTTGRADLFPALKQSVSTLVAAARRLGDAALLRLVERMADEVNELPAGPVPDAFAMEFATALLLAENACDNFNRLSTEFPQQVDAMCARLDVSKRGGTLSAEISAVPLLDEMARRVQERLLLSQVSKEIHSSLRPIEQILDAFFRDTTKRSELPSIAGYTRQVEGALRMLGLEQAADLLADCQKQIDGYIVPEGADLVPPTNQELESLAEALSALGFYIDAVERQQPDREMILRPMLKERLGMEFEEPAPVEEPVDEVAAEPVTVEAALADQKEQLSSLLDSLQQQPGNEEVRKELRQQLANVKQDAELLADAHLTEQTAAALALLDKAESTPAEALTDVVAAIAGGPVPVEVAPSAETQRLLTTAQDQLDAELLEIFLIEAEEVLGTIDESLTICRQQPSNIEALRTIRRGFHTLKGSGRMVGLNDLGEFAWGVEKTMNRWLEDERPATPSLLKMLSVAHENFGKWVEILKSGQNLVVEPMPLVNAIREIDPEYWPANLPEATPAAEAAPAPEAVPAPVPEPVAEVTPAPELEVVELQPLPELEPEPAPEPVAVVVEPEVPALAAEPEPEPAVSVLELELSLPAEPEPVAPVIGEIPAEPAVEALATAPAEPEPAAPEEIVIGETAISPTLYKILLDEAGELAATLEHELNLLQIDPSLTPSHPMVRAAHTLTGIHRTAGFPLVADTAYALEQTLLALQRLQPPLPDATLPVLADAIYEIVRLLDLIRNRIAFGPRDQEIGEGVRSHLSALLLGTSGEIPPDAEAAAVAEAMAEAAPPHVVAAPFGELVQELDTDFEPAFALAPAEEPPLQAVAEPVALAEPELAAPEWAAPEVVAVPEVVEEFVVSELVAEPVPVEPPAVSVEHLDIPAVEETPTELMFGPSLDESAVAPEAAPDTFEPATVEVTPIELAPVLAEPELELVPPVAAEPTIDATEPPELVLDLPPVDLQPIDSVSAPDVLPTAEIIEFAPLTLPAESMPVVEPPAIEAFAPTEAIIAEPSAPVTELLPDVTAEPEVVEAALPAAEPEATEIVAAPEPEAELPPVIEVQPAAEAEPVIELAPLPEPLIEEVPLSAVEPETTVAEPVPAMLDIIGEPGAAPVPEIEFTPAEIMEPVAEAHDLDEDALERAIADQLAASVPEPVLAPEPVPAAAEPPAAPDLGEAQLAAAAISGATAVAVGLPGAGGLPAAADEKSLEAAQGTLDPLAGINDELDDQLLPIFLEEANELGPQAGEVLRQWRADPDNTGYVQGLQRTLHTLKGSARMAGAMRLGQLTHMMESRLLVGDGLAKSSPELFEALEVDLDLIDHVLERLRAGEANSPLPGVAQAAAAAAPVSGVAAAAVPVAAQAATAAALPAGASAEAEAARAVLRVRADIIDRLVNGAGEVSIARARIEGEFRSLKQNLLELTNSVIRLRNQVREIEIQAETQMQSRISQLEELAREFDPLEFDRFTRFQELTRSLTEGINDVATVQQSLLKNLDDADAALLSQARMNRELQQELMAIRTVPFGSLSDRLYRIVRQTAKELDKRANLEIRGTQVELDRSVLEKLVAPLEHLLRNAVDHGLEDRDTRLQAGKPEIGEVTISVRQEGNEIVLALIDDGGGIPLDSVRERALRLGLIQADAPVTDAQLIECIFTPGFSTATQVTQISGRGVGMDVVRNEIAALGGRVEVTTRPGRGSSFTIYLPLTLAVAQVVLIRAGGRLFALPSPLVEQVQRIKADPLRAIYEAGELRWLNQSYPFFYLPRLLGDNESRPEFGRYNPVLLLKTGIGQVGVHVDEMLGNQEVVVKNIGPQLARVSGVAGATVLGTGEVVLILNPVPLALRRSQMAVVSLEAELAPAPAPVEAKQPAKVPLVMIVDDSLTVRKITGRLMAREGFESTTAKDGLDALQQLNDIRPDVILLDIEMPRMDGFEFAKTVKSDPNTRGIPIIMITSRTADKHRNHAMQLGVDVYLGKPYQEDELLAHVRRLTGQEEPVRAI